MENILVYDVIEIVNSVAEMLIIAFSFIVSLRQNIVLALRISQAIPLHWLFCWFQL